MGRKVAQSLQNVFASYNGALGSWACLTQRLGGGNLIPTSELHNCTHKAFLGISTAACKHQGRHYR